MRLEFTYTPEDLAEAAKALGKALPPGQVRGATFRGVFGWLLFIGLAVMLFMFLSRRNSPPRPRATTLPRGDLLGTFTALVPWILIFGFIWFFAFRNHRRRFKRLLDESPELQQPQTLDLGEDGIQLSAGLVTTTWKWAGLTGVLDTPNLLLLRTSNMAAIAIPKRAASGPGELARLQALVASRVAAPTGAFPVIPLAPGPADPADPAAERRG
jgi:hypothetical protein